MPGSLELALFHTCWIGTDLRKESDIMPKKKKKISRRRKKGIKTLMPLKKENQEKKSHILCLWTVSIGVLPVSNNSVT